MNREFLHANIWNLVYVKVMNYHKQVGQIGNNYYGKRESDKYWNHVFDEICIFLVSQTLQTYAFVYGLDTRPKTSYHERQ